MKTPLMLRTLSLESVSLQNDIITLKFATQQQKPFPLSPTSVIITKATNHPQLCSLNIQVAFPYRKWLSNAHKIKTTCLFRQNIKKDHRCQQSIVTNRDFLLRDNNCRVCATYSDGCHSSLVYCLKCILWNAVLLYNVNSRKVTNNLTDYRNEQRSV